MPKHVGLPHSLTKRTSDLLREKVIAGLKADIASHEDAICRLHGELDFVLSGGLDDASRNALDFRLDQYIRTMVDDYAWSAEDIASIINRAYGDAAVPFPVEVILKALQRRCDTGVLCRGLLVAGEVVSATAEQHARSLRPMFCLPEYFTQ